VVHGRSDPRVPLAEAEQALRERDRSVELVVFDDEGHGVTRDRNRRELLRRQVGFLDAHLAVRGG
jgi:dipeptidyl aminopeptidase/acylaminoacyl peptidase